MEQRMIGYTKGITRSSGDLMSEDGELMECINLKCENGELKPLLWPEKDFELNAGESLKYIHKGSGYENYLYIHEGKLKAFYFKDGKREDYSLAQAFSGELLFDAVGNTLVVSDANGLHYILFKNGEYKYLGQKPPKLDIDFRMVMDNLGRSFKKEGLVNDLPHPSDYELLDDYEKAMMNAIMGGINKVNSESLSEGKFVHPFLLRYAYRMYDGTSFMHSVPILFPINTYLSPFVSEKVDTGNIVVGTTAWALAFTLSYKIWNNSAITELQSNWSDIIKGVDIAVTPQIQSYEVSQKTNDYKILNIGKLKNNEVDSRFLLSYSVFYNNEDSKADKYSFKETFSKNRSFKALLDFGAGRLFFPELKDVKLIDKDIKNASLFYKLAYIPINKFVADGYYTSVDVTGKDFNTIQTWELLKDDYISNFNIKSSSLYSYNNRVNLSGVNINIKSPFKLSNLYPHLSVNNSGLSVNKSSVILSYDKLYSSELVVDNVNDGLYYNRYFFYPDVKAKEIHIGIDKIGDVSHDNKCFNIPLDEHIGLNGSVYFEGFNKSLLPIESVDEQSYEDAYFVKSNKVYTSEVNNPFVFNASGVNTVGTGEVLRIVSVTKALSQGQFGQFPLLALCSDGIWALTVNDEGLYSTKQMVSREVCNNPDSVVQTDNSVYFSSEKGLMVIDGSDVRCVTPQMVGLPMDIVHQKRMGDLLKSCTPIQNIVHASSDMTEFVDYLRESVIGYSYRDNSLYICHKDSVNYNYLYVYNIQNNTVSKLCYTEENVLGFLNRYPDTLMLGGVITDNKTSVYSLLKQHELEGKAVYGFVMTRPLKLGNPTGMKRIKQLKNIKNVHDKNSFVKYALWGSNDGLSWYYVGSYDGGFKYYRMGLFTKLRPNESVLGTVMLTELKKSNKLR